jgi:DNA transposition AAA+ family ATPase
MAFVTGPKDGGESSEKALVVRLRQFVEDSDLSFYKIASRIGTSGGILSMWLSERAKPGPEKLDAIEKFLKG